MSSSRARVPESAGSLSCTLRGRRGVARARALPTRKVAGARSRASWRVGRSELQTVGVRPGRACELPHARESAAPPLAEVSRATPRRRPGTRRERTDCIERCPDFVFEFLPPLCEVVLDESRRRVTRRSRRRQLAVPRQQGAALRRRLVQISFHRLHRRASS